MSMIKNGNKFITNAECFKDGLRSEIEAIQNI
jgi:hypothetical protein